MLKLKITLRLKLKTDEIKTKKTHEIFKTNKIKSGTK